MDDRLVNVLASLGFTAIHHDGDLSLWAAKDLRRVVRVRRSPDSVEIELLQDARYALTARGPLDAALLRGIESDLAAHAHAQEASDLTAFELAFTPVAQELALELVHSEAQAFSLCTLRYAGADTQRLELHWDSLANELQARHRSDHHALDRTWKRGAGSLRRWADDVANELRDALAARARPGV